MKKITFRDTMFSYFDQILENNFKNKMVMETMSSFIQKNIKNPDDYFIIEIIITGNKTYEILVKKEDIEIIYIYKSNYINGSLWGYSGCCLLPLDKQKFLLKEMCLLKKYNNEQAEIIKLFNTSKKYVMVNEYILSIEDILEEENHKKNIKKFYNFLHRDYRADKVSEESAKILLEGCYIKFQDALKDETLLFCDTGYEVHDVFIPYDIIIRKNKGDKDFCVCRNLLSAIVAKKEDDFYYFLY